MNFPASKTSQQTVPRGLNRRSAIVAAHDIIMAALSFEASVQLRYLFDGTTVGLGFIWQGAVLFAIVCTLVFWAVGLCRGIWHYASMNDLRTIMKAVTLAVLVFVPLMFLVTRLEMYPRSALLINWPLLVLMLLVPRILYRAFRAGTFSVILERQPENLVPVLLAGAGDRAETFIRDLRRSKNPGYRVVGIVDNNAYRIGRDIHGVRVLGQLGDIDGVIENLGRLGRKPQRLVITGDGYDGALVGDLLEAADRLGLELSRLPKLTDFRSGRAANGKGIEVRPVEVADLLGRSQKVLDRDAMRDLIAGRKVLITGAGGTIGSELARQVAALGPAHITLFDNGEYNLYQIDMEMDQDWPDLPRSAVLGDVRDMERVSVVFERETPEIVFHAAAFKHVPLVEANPNEAVLTNVSGTRNIADACWDSGAVMVLISTDKAVNPTSVMGATKRIAELYCQALSVKANGGAETGARFVTVRFGNVLGSTGSVVPLFQKQLEAGGPLTVTDPGVTRYFMTTREAVELVLQASALGRHVGVLAGPGSERGRIFVLDMGDPVRIDDLARQMIRLAGLQPEEDIQIVYTGLRPGEKLHEELFHEMENTIPTAAPGILLATPRIVSYQAIVPILDDLEATARRRDKPGCLDVIRTLVPEYEHTLAAPASRPARTAN
ncbi:MAG: polysaccharide biosynthesis protein [Rhodospirillales bacterium]|nr:polysaccharide biosynthesis protein [Rhodospirillales bacterium]